jgi:hypothetical protein
MHWHQPVAVSDINPALNITDEKEDQLSPDIG